VPAFLKRHPLPIAAHFEFCLVLTYAYPAKVLAPLLPPGLDLDTYEDYGFLAIALVSTRQLRPAGLPGWVGRSFFLSGYRIFARYQTRANRRLRGLRILRSDTDRRTMAVFGNLLTHYNYQLAHVQVDRDNRSVHVQIGTPDAAADLDVTADIGTSADHLPEGSPFPDFRTARLFAGPLPYTFDYEQETHSVIRIEGVRKQWNPRPVSVTVRKAGFLESFPFSEHPPLLANAFYLEDVPYMWRRGVREELHR
jgi:hypothetical protein